MKANLTLCDLEESVFTKNNCYFSLEVEKK
jgi:hypothetical protein